MGYDFLKRVVMIKKRYILGTLLLLIFILFFASILGGIDRTEDDEVRNSMMPRIGQKLWTYHMNKHEWSGYKKSDDEDSKDEIVLQVQYVETNGGYTSYRLLTGNAQVPKEDVWIGEASQEFLRGKNLYTYFPKNFEFYEVIFNGVKFVPKKLALADIEDIFIGYQIIKVSDLKKGKLEYKYSKTNDRFVILNDVGESFYKYYIVPNDSSKLRIEEFSNQFKVLDSVDVKLQRLEGCSEAYPCYEINIK